MKVLWSYDGRSFAWFPLGPPNPSWRGIVTAEVVDKMERRIASWRESTVLGIVLLWTVFLDAGDSVPVVCPVQGAS